MKHKKLWIALVILIAAFLVGMFLLKDKATTKTAGEYSKITDLGSAYHIEEAIAEAKAALKKNPEPATVLTNELSGKKQIALTFDGLTDDTTMMRILDVLKKYKVQATFFVEGINTAENPKIVSAIEKAGHKIGNYTWVGMSQVEKMSQEQMLIDFCRTQKIIKVTTDKLPTLLKCSKTIYNQTLLQTAKACGIESVVKNDVFLPRNQIHSLNEANAFVNTLKPGSIVSVQIGTPVEAKVVEQGKTDDRPAVDKQPSVKEMKQRENVKNEDVLDEIERVLITLQVQKYDVKLVEEFPKIRYKAKEKKTAFMDILHEVKRQLVDLFTCKTAYAATTDEFENLRTNNGGKLAQEIKMIPTTQQAVVYSFGGLAKENVVDDILYRLDGKGITATFFIFEREMKQYPQVLRKIIAHGHEIGVAIRPKDDAGFEQVCGEIISARQVLKEDFGIETNLVKQPWGAISAVTKEAVSALQCQLIGQSVNVVQSKHKEAKSAEEVMSQIFGKSVFSLARGQIVHFRMDYYANDNLLGNLVEMIKKRKIDNIAYTALDDDSEENPANDSRYTIESIGKVFSNRAFRYEYPVNLENVPEQLRSENKPVHVNLDDFKAQVVKRYIGSPEVDEDDRVLGFGHREIRRLDSNGTVRTDAPVIFLTFDDWGTDAAVNKLLYVLRKHKATGTFFVITHNVLNNPNLLRAIAADGNEIGSHTNMHKAMVVRDEKTGKQRQTQTATEYREDIVTSYQRLESVVGDVQVNGNYALTRFFRPPTLAISKIGFETLWDSGYTYIVSGSCSTKDYAAKSLCELVQLMQSGLYDKTGNVKKGAILVMHMSDNAQYTARALDLILTANEAKADGDPSKFRIGRLSDYLKDDYTQGKRKIN